MNKNKRMILLGLYICMALVLSIIENYLPTSFIIPGIKIGFANIVLIIAFDHFNWKETFCIVIIRIILGSIFSGGLSGMIYSLAGGLLSYTVMALVYYNVDLSKVTISILGAFFHSVGQIVIAVLVLENVMILTYLPIMLVVSMIAGLFIGIIGVQISSRMQVILQN